MFYLFTITIYLNEEVSCSEPFSSVSIPWFVKYENILGETGRSDSGKVARKNSSADLRLFVHEQVERLFVQVRQQEDLRPPERRRQQRHRVVLLPPHHRLHHHVL
jgi:hypothetical protein